MKLRLSAAALASSALIACLGCTSVRQGTLSDEFELAAWKRVEIGHLHVYTNVSPEQAKRTLRRLDRFVSAVSRFVFAREFKAARPVEILLFRSAEQFGRFEKRPEVVGYAHPDWDGQPISIAMSQEPHYLNARGLLNHELVHAILFGAEGRSFPRWFHEGLSEFFYAATVREDVITLGGLPQHRIPIIRTRRAPPLRRLFARRGGVSERFYGYAWLFVHYGFFAEHFGGIDRSQQFWRFVSLASQGVPWRDAFDRGFGVPLEQIESEFAAYRQRILAADFFPQKHVVIETDESDYRFVSVDAIDMARRLASHAARHPGAAARLAGELFDLVLATSPLDSIALHGQLRLATGQRELDRADALLARLDAASGSAAPGELSFSRAQLAHERYRALGSRARERRGGDLIRAARGGYRALLAAQPDRVSALAALGDSYVLEAGADPQPGIEALVRALARRPGWPSARLNLAKLYLRASEFEKARPQLENLLDAYPLSSEAAEARRLLRRHDVSVKCCDDR